MGSLGDKLGRLDDAWMIYRANDPEHGVAWGRAALACLAGSMLVGGLGLLGRATGAERVVRALGFAACITFLVAYVIWRRSRNRRLTGSPTEAPPLNLDPPIRVVNEGRCL